MASTIGLLTLWLQPFKKFKQATKTCQTIFFFNFKPCFLIITRNNMSVKLLTRSLLVCNSFGGHKYRHLFNVSYKKNSPSRMRTVTPENQYQRLLESATPLSKCSYSEQLMIKRAALERALRKVVNIIQHNKRGSLTPDMERSIEENQGCICPLVDMKPSPKTEEFRNKEELNINRGVDGDPNTVGLIIGRGENSFCVPCDGLINSKPLHHKVVKAFKSFLAQSEFRKRGAEESYASSYWSKVLVRSNEKGQVMLVPELKCREITQEVIDQAKDELIRFYCSGSQVSPAIHSLYLRVRYRNSRMYHSQHHVHGDTHIFEEVLGYKFRISPEAFFQLNTPGAEVLYREVQDLVQACHPQTLLDIGCGTGTIGIMTSSLVDRVIGFDVVEQAVKDAEFNASLNGVDASFLVGRARCLTKTYMLDGDILTDETMAVVNPSRNGLNWKAIQRLRCCETIKHIVFISCKPHGNALINFVDLIVPESENHPGQPFRAVKAMGVDMFPHTVHSELVLLFQR